MSTVTRWTVAVALAATGFFAGLASQVGRGSASTSAKATAARAKARTRHRFASTSQTLPQQQQQQQQPTVLPAQSSNGFAPIVSGAS